MPNYFLDLLVKAGQLWFQHMGTTAIGLGCGLLVPCYRLLSRWHGGEPMKSIWTDVRWGLVITSTVWIGLFIWCLAKIIYENHRTQLEANTNLRSENDRIKSENRELKKKDLDRGHPSLRASKPES